MRVEPERIWPWIERQVSIKESRLFQILLFCFPLLVVLQRIATENFNFHHIHILEPSLSCYFGGVIFWGTTRSLCLFVSHHAQIEGTIKHDKVLGRKREKVAKDFENSIERDFSDRLLQIGKERKRVILETARITMLRVLRKQDDEEVATANKISTKLRRFFLTSRFFLCFGFGVFSISCGLLLLSNFLELLTTLELILPLT